MPLRITVEVIPNGHEFASQIVGSIDIENIGGSDERGTYSYQVYGEAPMDGTLEDRTRGRGWIMGHGEVEGFPRKRQSVWHLLESILRHKFGKGS